MTVAQSSAPSRRRGSMKSNATKEVECDVGEAYFLSSGGDNVKLIA